MNLVINKVKASNGWQWINEGFRYFVQAKFIWVVTVFMVAFYPLVLGNISPILQLLVFFLLPLFAAGLACACADIENGKSMSLKYLFKALESPNKINIFKYGLLLLLMIFVAQMVISIVLNLMGINIGDIKTSIESLKDPNLSAIDLINDSPVLIKYLIVTMFIMIPVIIINFMAPIVLVFTQFTALESVIYCFKAGWKNFSAFIVYALSYMVIALIIVLVLKVVLFVLAAVLGEKSMIVSVIYLLLLSISFLSLAAISYSSAYVAYKDIFLEKK